ncbi:hypothetical protein M378DRAFT_13650 [Amanita muscaria Koide BX008]|uniref:Uncharacterized protein n=1 Tax=Amanita muscaria (strain Koide BX008) TaxID=946122 RepID=A0A0C2WI90_AMAMK|nr:hypothetical protein M378DRAFT_13650 [Amanita muscaria Koide BX008]
MCGPRPNWLKYGKRSVPAIVVGFSVGRGRDESLSLIKKGAASSAMDSSRPPTLNFLGPFQRSRLLKSSRKIEYILGTTPHVLESSDFPHHIVDGHPPDGMLRRLKTKKRQDHHSTRLQLSPVSPLTDDSSTSDLPSPIPLTVSIPHSSARLVRTLTEPPDHHQGMSPDRLHRKQMAKLTRVLGENIPPELVRYQNARNAHHGDSMTRRPRRKSSSCPPSPDHQSSSASSTSPPPPNLTSVTSPSPPPLSAPASSSRILHAAKGNERRSPSSGIPPGSSSPTSLEGSQRSNGSSSGSGRSPPQSVTYPLLTSDQRDEARWNGEWNVKDTERRAVALRNLKRR